MKKFDSVLYNKQMERLQLQSHAPENMDVERFRRIMAMVKNNATILMPTLKEASKRKIKY